jgi:hypothetical protein
LLDVQLVPQPHRVTADGRDLAARDLTEMIARSIDRLAPLASRGSVVVWD